VPDKATGLAWTAGGRLTLPMDLDDLRARFQSHGLTESEVDADPGAQFSRWFDEAVEAGMREPEAMIVSTVTADGVPSSRHVLVRDWADGMLTFFTNYESQKGRELDVNPMIAACFPWNVLGRQVRVTGRAERTSAEVSDAYFATRDSGSQIGAWASAQSSVLTGRDELERRVAEVEARFAGVDVPRPPHWGGYRIVPIEWEFWQGRPSRLHDRIRYRRDDPSGSWIIERLSP
jgi:pyridoxamine 5'-phosphate oxidase